MCLSRAKIRKNSEKGKEEGRSLRGTASTDAGLRCGRLRPARLRGAGKSACSLWPARLHRAGKSLVHRLRGAERDKTCRLFAGLHLWWVLFREQPAESRNRRERTSAGGRLRPARLRRAGKIPKKLAAVCGLPGFMVSEKETLRSPAERRLYRGDGACGRHADRGVQGVADRGFFLPLR